MRVFESKCQCPLSQEVMYEYRQQVILVAILTDIGIDTRRRLSPIIWTMKKSESEGKVSDPHDPNAILQPRKAFDQLWYFLPDLGGDGVFCDTRVWK